MFQTETFPWQQQSPENIKLMKKPYFVTVFLIMWIFLTFGEIISLVIQTHNTWPDLAIEPDINFFQLWEEVGVPGENPSWHMKNKQTLHRKAPEWLVDSNPEYSSCNHCEAYLEVSLVFVILFVKIISLPTLILDENPSPCCIIMINKMLYEACNPYSQILSAWSRSTHCMESSTTTVVVFF